MPHMTTLSDAELDALVEMYLPRHPAWRRSRKGNFYRRVGDVLYTIFRRRDGPYGYCIAPKHGTATFSPFGYATEPDAIQAVLERIDL